MRRVVRSKEPTITAMRNIAANLSRINSSVKVEVSHWNHSMQRKEDNYKISIVWEDEGCDIYNYRNWPGLIDGYRRLVKRYPI